MIALKNVSKSFGSKQVLKNVSFETGKGEILFIIGKSGTGKSVLLKTIVGLLRPDEGEVWVDEFRVHKLREQRLFEVRRVAALVFQNPALLDFLTIYENLGLGAEHEDTPEVIRKEKAFESLMQVKVFEEQAHDLMPRYPHELSFSLQKRISIARSLMFSPTYLLFDEPTTGFDPIANHGIHELIKDLQNSLGVTTIVVSHDIENALMIADRILFLDAGEIVALGTPEELRNSKVPIVQDFLKEGGA